MTSTQRTRLGDLLTLSYGKPLDPQDRNEEGSIPVYGANGIKTYSDRYLIDFPTIIVGRKGSAGELNMCDGPCWPLDVTYFVEHDKTVTKLSYLFYLLLDQNLPSLARGIKPGINRNDVYSIEVVIPDIEEQSRVVELLATTSEAAGQIRQKLDEQYSSLADLERSILRAALSGDL